MLFIGMLFVSLVIQNVFNITLELQSKFWLKLRKRQLDLAKAEKQGAYLLGIMLNKERTED